MFEETTKRLEDMTIEEQKKYYDEQTDNLINVIVSRIIRNQIIMNGKLKNKIKNKVEEMIKEELNDLL